MIILVSAYFLYIYSEQDSREEKEKEVTCMIFGQKLA